MSFFSWLLGTVMPEDACPDKIAINCDAYAAKHIGTANDKQQFFLTTPFVPAEDGCTGCEYIALFLFDMEGNFIEAKIDQLGPRGSYTSEAKEQLYLAHLNALRNVEYGRIEIKPFSTEQHDTEFGLIVFPPENSDDEYSVELHPGNYMAFYAPWDSGDYDT